MSDLAGKDYFTVEQAADYSGICLSHWKARVQPEFPPGVFKGKLLYRRVDVARYVETSVKAFGRIDLFANNAGLLGKDSVPTLDAEHLVADGVAVAERREYLVDSGFHDYRSTGPCGAASMMPADGATFATLGSLAELPGWLG